MNIKALLTRNIILENKRVLLRPLSMMDLESLLPIALESELWKVGMTEIRDRQDLEHYIEQALSDRTKGLSYPFVIVDKDSNQIAGSTRYSEITPQFKRLEIGWTWLSKNTRGSGLNKACKYELLRFAFEELLMNRVEIKTDALNLRSRAAIKKLGATEEGILRSHMITHSGRVRDTVMHSILSSEWPRIQQEVFGEYL